MQKGKPRTISEALIEAIEESGLSFKAIETQSGVKRQSLMKFVRGEQSLRHWPTSWPIFRPSPYEEAIQKGR